MEGRLNDPKGTASPHALRMVFLALSLRIPDPGTGNRYYYVIFSRIPVVNPPISFYLA